MATRYLEWYVDNITGDGTFQGMVHCVDMDYTLTHAKVRIHAKQAPDAGVMSVDIKDDGVSIFDGSRYPNLQKGRQSEEDWDAFSTTASRIEQFSYVSLDILNSAGAKGISVTLELEEEAAGQS